MSTRTDQGIASPQQEPDLPTFMDHLQELKGRFFWVAIAFVGASALAYPRFNDIVNFLTQPLGNQKLYYLTVAGGFSFMIKICMYVGVIAVLPVIIYHLYKFITPVMNKNRSRSVLLYTLSSSLLALSGIAFSYFIILPAALKFLTGININHIDSMLTIDSYLSFVMAYVVAGALLFQLPLVMLIINSVNPLSPKKLMGYQRHMIVASFILAAVLSPTPDVVNQTLLAAPVVVMYQIGIFMIWLKQRKTKKTTVVKPTVAATHDTQSAAPRVLSAAPRIPQLTPANLCPLQPRPSVVTNISQGAARQQRFDLPQLKTPVQPVASAPKNPVTTAPAKPKVQQVAIAQPPSTKPKSLSTTPATMLATQNGSTNRSSLPKAVTMPARPVARTSSLYRASVYKRPVVATRRHSIDGFAIPSSAM